MGGHTDSRNGDLRNAPWQVASLNQVNIHPIAVVNHKGESLSYTMSFGSRREVSAFEAVQCNQAYNAITFLDFYFSFREWFLGVGEK